MIGDRFWDLPKMSIESHPSSGRFTHAFEWRSRKEESGFEGRFLTVGQKHREEGSPLIF